MAKFRFDRSSKWLVEHHGDTILRLGGLTEFTAWRAAQPEVVQPRQLPDGLLEIKRTEQSVWEPVVAEIETYPDAQTADDVMDDIMLVYQDRRVVPDVVVLVLHPKGKAHIMSERILRSPSGLTIIQAQWRVVELWNVPADTLLATNDPGMMPWVPLARIDGPPDPVLQECRRIIDEAAPAQEHENLLAVIQVLAGLRYNEQLLRAIFGGKEAMIDSPILNSLIAEKQAEALHEAILDVLEERLGEVPVEVKNALIPIQDRDRLKWLNKLAARCGDFEAFKRHLIP